MSADIPAWLTILIAGASGLLGGGVAYGSLVTRVSRLEADVKERASKESVDFLREQLTEIKTLLKVISDRLSRHGEAP